MVHASSGAKRQLSPRSPSTFLTPRCLAVSLLAFSSPSSNGFGLGQGNGPVRSARPCQHARDSPFPDASSRGLQSSGAGGRVGGGASPRTPPLKRRWRRVRPLAATETSAEEEKATAAKEAAAVTHGSRQSIGVGSHGGHASARRQAEEESASADEQVSSSCQISLRLSSSSCWVAPARAPEVPGVYSTDGAEISGATSPRTSEEEQPPRWGGRRRRAMFADQSRPMIWASIWVLHGFAPQTTTSNGWLSRANS